MNPNKEPAKDQERQKGTVVKNLNRIILVVAVVALSVAASSPANAVCASATADGASSSATSDFALASGLRAPIVSPKVIGWAIFETNIGNEAKCESLLNKMRAAYPSS
jgi:hypothetical protein